MTIRFPQKNILDKILAVFGKKKEIIFLKDADKIYSTFGPYVNIKAKKESFWKVLFSVIMQRK